MDLVLELLNTLAESRTQFVRRTQMTPYHRFFENEQMYLAIVRDLTRMPSFSGMREQESITQLAQRILTMPQQQRVIVRTDFWDAHPVQPTAQQLARALQPIGFSDNQCAICQETLQTGTPIQLQNCRHQFHSACIRQWLSINPHCPVCRNDIRETHEQANNDAHLRAHANPQPPPPPGDVQGVPAEPNSPQGNSHVDHSGQFGRGQ